jgi:hypothetical protein
MVFLKYIYKIKENCIATVILEISYSYFRLKRTVMKMTMTYEHPRYDDDVSTWRWWMHSCRGKEKGNWICRGEKVLLTVFCIHSYIKKTVEFCYLCWEKFGDHFFCLRINTCTVTYKAIKLTCIVCSQVTNTYFFAELIVKLGQLLNRDKEELCVI